MSEQFVRPDEFQTHHITDQGYIQTHQPAALTAITPVAPPNVIEEDEEPNVLESIDIDTVIDDDTSDSSENSYSAVQSNKITVPFLGSRHRYSQRPSMSAKRAIAACFLLQQSDFFKKMLH